MAEDNPVARIAFFISTVICCCQGVANFRGEYIATGTCSVRSAMTGFRGSKGDGVKDKATVPIDMQKHAARM